MTLKPPPPAFLIGPMSERDAEEICSWRYPQPYETYRWPSWETMKTGEKEFGDPRIREEQYASVRDREGRLIGYAQFFPLVGVVRLGVGLRPDCCDLGWGPAFIQAVAEEAARRSPGAEIDLEVETWNRRAIRAYEKAGFAATDRYDLKAAHGIVSILCMVKR
jgi:ribosomal protein S18 acetylase RimI-like enzyme